MEYHFIHKSVVEFHAARFVSHTTEENARRFYGGILNGKWHKWRQELEFLSQIDRYRYLAYFFVPSAMEAQSAYDIDFTSEGEVPSLKVRAILDSIEIVPKTPETGGDAYPTFVFHNSHCYMVDLIELLIFRRVGIKLREKFFTPKGLTERVKLGMFLLNQGSLDVGVKAVNEALSTARSLLARAKSDIARESKVSEFVDP